MHDFQIFVKVTEKVQIRLGPEPRAPICLGVIGWNVMYLLSDIWTCIVRHCLRKQVQFLHNLLVNLVGYQYSTGYIRQLVAGPLNNHLFPSASEKKLTLRRQCFPARRNGQEKLVISVSFGSSYIPQFWHVRSHKYGLLHGIFHVPMFRVCRTGYP